MLTSAPSPAVLAAYRECERITGDQARNFAWGIRLLTTPKRRALSAVYAFARRVDDIGDGDLSDAEKLRLLAEARDAVSRPGDFPDDPVLVALADAAGRLPIPLDAFGELVDGCEMDVRGDTYDSLDDLAVYCRCVAGSIGRLSLGVFNPVATDPATVARTADLANTLGIALQLTNILRDIREDLGNGRIYLPRKDLELFGVTLSRQADGTLDPCDGALAELIRFEAARAWGYYDRGLQLLPLLDRRSAACCAALAGLYHELLARIAAEPARVMRGRTSLPTRDKLTIAAKSLLGAAAGGRGHRHD
jgi:15-cis-phytoene synthase